MSGQAGLDTLASGVGNDILGVANVYYNEAVRQKRGYYKENREERQGKSRIPRGTNIETPHRR